MPIGETIKEHAKLVEEAALIVASDMSNKDPKRGGLWRGCFPSWEPPTAGPTRGAIIDFEDGVERCPTCAWELEDGYCNSCSVYIGMSDDDVVTSWGGSVSGNSIDYPSLGDALPGSHLFGAPHDNWGEGGTSDDESGNDDISLDGNGQPLHGYGGVANRENVRIPPPPPGLNNRRFHTRPNLQSNAGESENRDTLSDEDSREDDFYDAEMDDFIVTDDDVTSEEAADFLDNVSAELGLLDEEEAQSDGDPGFSPESPGIPLSSAGSRHVNNGIMPSHPSEFPSGRAGYDWSASDDEEPVISTFHRRQPDRVRRPTRDALRWSTTPDPDVTGTRGPSNRIPHRSNNGTTNDGEMPLNRTSNHEPQNQSEEDLPPTPQRHRRRRRVVDFSSDAEAGTGPPKNSNNQSGAQSSSGSMTVGRLSPNPSTNETMRGQQFAQQDPPHSPIPIESSPERLGSSSEASSPQRRERGPPMNRHQLLVPPRRLSHSRRLSDQSSNNSPRARETRTTDRRQRKQERRRRERDTHARA